MSKIRVVLIEDHFLTRLGLKTAIEEQPDIDCVGDASSGKEGLEMLYELKPDVAVLDIGLPDIDGIEVTQRYKTTQKKTDTLNTKILILTSHDSEDAVLAAFATGADSYCMKSIDLPDLMSAIRDTYAGNSWIDSDIASIILRQVRNVNPVSTTQNENRTVEINAIAPEIEPMIESEELTERQMEILELIVAGNNNAEIAQRLFISLTTVKTHVRNILIKLGVSDRTQAAVRALRSGLVQ